jgi:hypothetical protein
MGALAALDRLGGERLGGDGASLGTGTGTCAGAGALAPAPLRPPSAPDALRSRLSSGETPGELPAAVAADGSYAPQRASASSMASLAATTTASGLMDGPTMIHGRLGFFNSSWGSCGRGAKVSFFKQTPFPARA